MPPKDQEAVSGRLDPFQMKANGNHDANGKNENVEGCGKKDGTYSLKHTNRNNKLRAYTSNLSQPWRQGIRVIFSHKVPP